MIKSIEEYGGFYIGRYELSGSSSSPKVVRYGNSGGISWYDSYVACSKLTNEDAIGTMIWGTQWDATLEWLAQSYIKDNTTGKSYKDIASSARWGNYSDSDNFTYYTSSTDTTGTAKSGSTKIPTGSTEYTKANNIYDLAGNCGEWTQEACDTNGRVLRRRRLRHWWVGWSSFWSRRRLSRQFPRQLFRSPLTLHKVELNSCKWYNNMGSSAIYLINIVEETFVLINQSYIFHT